MTIAKMPSESASSRRIWRLSLGSHEGSAGSLPVIPVSCSGLSGTDFGSLYQDTGYPSHKAPA